MNSTKQLKLIISSVTLFLVVVAISAAFSVANVEKPYADAIIARYEQIAIELKNKLDNAHDTYGAFEYAPDIHNILRDAQKRLEENLPRTDLVLAPDAMHDDNDTFRVYLTSPEGDIRYHTGRDSLSRGAGVSYVVLADENTGSEQISTKLFYLKHGTSYFIRLPITSGARTVATVVLELPVKYITPHSLSALRGHAREAIGFLLISVVVFIIVATLGLRAGGVSDSSGRFGFIAAISCLVFVTQLTSFAFISYASHQDLVRLSSERVDLQGVKLKDGLEQLLSQGVDLEHSPYVKRTLADTLDLLPELEHATIATTDGLPLYTLRSKTDEYLRSNSTFGAFRGTFSRIAPTLHYPLQINGEVDSVLAMGLSSRYFFDKAIKLVFNGFTVIAISILIFIELLVLQRLFIRTLTDDREQRKPMSYGYMRPAIFIVLFGIDSSLSFLPLHMENIYQPMFGMSKEFVISLPITVEFLFVGVSILIAGVWLDKKGWREPFLGGLALAAAGSVYSALAPDALQFIASRALVGTGYGLALMASQGFVITHSDPRSKAQGLAHLFAGLYAGSICGGAAGGMLAEHYGYQFVFFTGAAVILLAIAYTYFFMAAPEREQATPAVEVARPRFFTRELGRFLLNRNILGLVFLSSFPAAIAVVGFLNYFSPLYLNKMGASESTIGQVLIIYGVCLILAGPAIGKYVDATEDKQPWIFFGSLLGGAAFLTFYFFDGIFAAVIAIFLLGLSSSLVLSSQSAYALQLAVTQDLGQGKAIAIFRATSRAGQALGPIIFATIIAATNMSQGIVVLGAVYVVMAVLFLLVTRNSRGLYAVEGAKSSP